MNAPRTLLAVLVGAAEPLVGPYRARLDPTARRGLGAHVTIHPPFGGELPPDALDRLRAAVATVPAADVTFHALRWFGDDVLWLAPADPGPFRALACAASGLGLPPARHTFVPHLTVGLRRAAPLSALHDAEAALSPALPLVARVEHLHVLVRADRWATAAALPLG